MDYIKLTNDTDTIKGYFTYEKKTLNLILRIELNKELNFTSDVFISFFKFADMDAVPVTTGIKDKNIFYLFDDYFNLKFIRNFENIEMITKTDFIIYRYDGINLFKKLHNLMVEASK